jgi:hypothetical protein
LSIEFVDVGGMLDGSRSSVSTSIETSDVAIARGGPPGAVAGSNGSSGLALFCAIHRPPDTRMVAQIRGSVWFRGVGDYNALMERRPQRSARRVVAVASFGVGAALLAGCSLIVDFVAKDLPSDGGDDEASPLDVVVEASDEDTTVPPDAPDVDAGTDSSRADVRVDSAQCPNPCRNRINGWYCGTDMLYCLAPADDLYHCVADASADVTHCGQGAGCVQLPVQHPDTCDPCPGKGDGTYCGRDLASVVPHVPGDDKNDIYLFACQGGRISLASKACITDCTGAPPNAKCNPN